MEELQDFRELFMANRKGQDGATEDHGLSVDDVIRLIGRICVLTEEHAGIILRTVRDIKRECGEIGSNASIDDIRSVDFPEFLRLMGWLLESNFGRIKQSLGAS